MLYKVRRKRAYLLKCNRKTTQRVFKLPIQCIDALMRLCLYVHRSAAKSIPSH